MKTSSIAIVLLVSAGLWPDLASARNRVTSSAEYRVVSGGHVHAEHGFLARPWNPSNRYPRFYATGSHTKIRTSDDLFYGVTGYRVIQSRGVHYPRYYYRSHIGFIGRPYIHVANDREGCHPYTHFYHHDDWRLSRVFRP